MKTVGIFKRVVLFLFGVGFYYGIYLKALHEDLSFPLNSIFKDPMPIMIVFFILGTFFIITAIIGRIWRPFE